MNNNIQSLEKKYDNLISDIERKLNDIKISDINYFFYKKIKILQNIITDLSKLQFELVKETVNINLTSHDLWKIDRYSNTINTLINTIQNNYLTPLTNKQTSYNIFFSIISGALIGIITSYFFYRVDDSGEKINKIIEYRKTESVSLKHLKKNDDSILNLINILNIKYDTCKK